MATNGKCLSFWKTIWRKPRRARVAPKRLKRKQQLPLSNPDLAVAQHREESHVSQPLFKRLVAETVGTAMLLTAIVGSGIMGERLAAGNVAIALLANSIATGGALVVLILIFGPISG